MIALIVSLGLVFSMTTGYAYGTARVDMSVKKERKRPEKLEEKALNLEKLSLPTNYPDGEFFGTAEGYSGEIEVRVVVRGGKIVELEVIRQTETPGYYENGLLVIGKVLEKGDLNVDTISGATITSHAILKAAAKALGASMPDKTVVKTTNPPMPQRENLTFHNLKDGKWQGSAQGYADLLNVEVVVEKGKIVSAYYLSGQDDEPYLSNAKTILKKVVENQGTSGVDVYSGATYTSLGLLNAVNQALKKANGESSTLSSSEIESYKMQVKKLNEELDSLKSRLSVIEFDDGEGVLKDGTYEGSAIGYNGEVFVEVYVINGKLQKATLKKHTDDKEYMDKVLPLLKEVVKYQGTKGVDTITGATFSSNGLLGGASNALRLARGLVPITSGGNSEQIKRLNEDIERLKAQLKANESDVTAPLKDGEYSAKASGYGGLVEVLMTVKEGKIKSLRLGIHNEDSEYVDKAFTILDKIVELNGTKGVEVVSGATYTSNGILNATRIAMKKASGEKVSEEDAPELVSKEKLVQVEDELQTLKDKLLAFTKDNAVSAENKADGEYTGYGKGYANRLIKAVVNVKNKKIIKVVLIHREDRGEYLSEARETQIINAIIEKNGTKGVDTLSGATLSTAGIIQAVNDALKNSGASMDNTLLDTLNQSIERLKESILAIFNDRKDFVFEVAQLESDLPLLDGEYTGYGVGWSKTREGKSDESLSEEGNPPPYNIVTSVVRIENGKIVEITSTEPSSKRSRNYLNWAREIHEDIIEDNGIANVDIETGATYTTRGIVEAVNMALSKSKEAYKANQNANQELNHQIEVLEQLRKENEALKAELEALKTSNG